MLKLLTLIIIKTESVKKSIEGVLLGECPDYPDDT